MRFRVLTLLARRPLLEIQFRMTRTDRVFLRPASLLVIALRAARKPQRVTNPDKPHIVAGECKLKHAKSVVSRIAPFNRLTSPRISAALILTVLMLLGAAATTLATAQTFTTLHSFNGTDGANPFAVPIQATDGNLYGTTGNDGANGQGGTVFKITPSGKLTTLYSFCSQPGCADGYFPGAALVQATDGNLYGPVNGGGANGQGGTVFKITLRGELTTLYNFCSQSGCTDGEAPGETLIQATDGYLYGTTVYGGTTNCGTIFRITLSGTFTRLHSFNRTDGCNLLGPLMQAADGNLYGTTEWGGTSNDGTIFKITPGGKLTTLYNFCSQSGCTDGSAPNTGLVQASDGNFYGTAPVGGAWGGGVVFKMTPSGAVTTFYSFCSQSGCADGEEPLGTLIQATDGNLYGTTSGGSYGQPTVFQMTLGGTLNTLHSFCPHGGCAQLNIYQGVVQATDGSFYGTTYSFGASNEGTVYKVSVGLGPFVETQPNFGRVGRAARILGTDLTGTTGVSFNGTPATFTVLSRSLITAIVPDGATTGFVTVTTPTGTLTSNKQFVVRQ